MKNVLLHLEFYISSVQRLHKGVVEYAQERDWHLTVSGPHFTFPEYWNGDGVLLHLNDAREKHAFLKRNPDIPVVSFTMPIKNSGLKFSTVREDDFKIGKIAAQHFIENGCRHACWYGSGKIDLRGRSFLRRMRHRGIDTSLITPPISPREVPWDLKNTWLAEQLSKLSLPCSVFCENDAWAYEILEAALLVGLKIPEDISILGVDNNSLVCECLKVPLSSVDNRLERVGYEGAALLDAMMDGKRGPHELILVPPAPEVVARKSTDALAIDHPNLKRAVAYIRENFDSNDISVKKIAQAAYVSESGIRKLFKKHFNTSVLHLVHKLRIQKACSLLRETSLKIDAIASQVGFGDTRRFYDVFTREMSTSPARFRKEQAEVF